MYFRNYGLQNTSLDKCLKSLVSEQASTVNMVKGKKHCWNLFDKTFIISITLRKISWKMSLLVIFEILELFLNIFTVDDKYSFPNSENLPQPIQLQLLKKQNIFSIFC